MTESQARRRAVRRPAQRPARRLALHLRRLDVRDVAVLLKHRRAMLLEVGGPSADVLDRYLPRFRRWLVPRLRSGEVMAFGVEQAGSIVGSGCLWNAPDHPRADRLTNVVPYVFSMYTDPDHRGMGVATRVIHAAERAAVSAGADRIRLHAAPNARRLYRELGYVRGWEMRKRLLRPSRRPRPASARRRRRGR